MMKRLIAFILVCTMLSSLSCFAQDITEINEDFNADVFKADEWELGEQAKTAYVPGNKNSDRSLQLYTNTDKSTYAAVNIPKQLEKGVFDMNIRCENDRLERQFIIISDKTEYALFTLASNGKIVFSNSSACNIKDYRKGQWYHIAAAVDLENGSLSLYADGVMIGKASVQTEGVKYFDGVKLQQKGAAGEADITFIDDFRVYGGTAPYSEYTVKKSTSFSTVAVDRPEGELSAGSSTDYSQTKLLCYYDFESCTDSEKGPQEWTSVPNNGKVGGEKIDKRHGYSVKLSGSKSSANPILAKDLFDYKLCADTMGDFIMDFDVLFSDSEHMSIFSIKDDNNDTNHDIIRTTTGGGWAYISEKDEYRGSYNGSKWYSMQIVFHSDGTQYTSYDIYLNNEKTADKLPIKGDAFRQVKYIKICHYGKDGSESFVAVDNYKIYPGNEPVKNLDVSSFIDETIGEENEKIGTPFDEPEIIKERLQGYIVIANNAEKAIVNGECEQLDPGNADIKVKIANDRTYVPIRFISERIGAQVEWDGENRKVIIKNSGDELVFTVDSPKIYINGNEEETDAAPFFENGRVFVPLRVITRMLGKGIKWFSNGIVAIGEKYDTFDNFEKTVKLTTLKECAYRLLTCPHPMAEMFKSDIRGNVHPRITITQADLDRTKGLIDKDDMIKTWYRQMKESADLLLEKPVSEYNLAGAGGVLLNVSRETKSRVENLAVMYQISGDERYKERLWKELEAVCGFPDWNEINMLSCAEMTYAVTIAYDWMYNDWSAQQREFLEKSIYEKALLKAKSAYEDTGLANYWAYAQSNWNSVSNGNLGMAAVALMNVYPDICTEILENAFNGLSYFLPVYANGGGFGEGPGYWTYATKYLAYFMASCENTFGTDYGIFNTSGISETAYFMPYMTGGKVGFNFHDSSEVNETSPELLYLGKRGGYAAPMQKYRLYMVKNSLSASNVYDMLWYDPDLKSDTELPFDRKFDNIATASFRSAWEDTDCTYAGIHAGSINDGHPQLDMGDFVLDALGERWACELAMEDYSYEGYFGDFRWTFYRARAEGQNTVVVNPSKNPDQESTSAKGRIERFESKPKGGYTVIDLLSGYPDAVSAKRGLMLTDDRSTVIVQDEFKLKDESDVYWFMHTKADIEISEDKKTATLTQNGKTMYAHIISDSDLSFGVMDAKPLHMSPNPKQSENKNVRKLMIHAEYAADFSAAVVFSPYRENLEREYVPLNDWSIANGEIEKPCVSAIYANDKLIEDFSKTKLSYTITIPATETDVPKITADSNYQVEISQSDSALNPTKIKVTNPDKSWEYTEYTINYRIDTIFGRPEGMTKINIKEATASESPQADLGYTPDKTIDGDLTTRWSAEAVNYLQYDLGEEYNVSAVSIAWLNGSQRIAYYQIDVSEDGENWTTAFNGLSSGTTNLYETCTFAPVKGRYVRLTGFGTNQNKWISPNEVEIYSR